MELLFDSSDLPRVMAAWSVLGYLVLSLAWLLQLRDSRMRYRIKTVVSRAGRPYQWSESEEVCEPGWLKRLFYSRTAVWVSLGFTFLLAIQLFWIVSVEAETGGPLLVECPIWEHLGLDQYRRLWDVPLQALIFPGPCLMIAQISSWLRDKGKSWDRDKIFELLFPYGICGLWGAGTFALGGRLVMDYDLHLLQSVVLVCGLFAGLGMSPFLLGMFSRPDSDNISPAESRQVLACEICFLAGGVFFPFWARYGLLVGALMAGSVVIVSLAWSAVMTSIGAAAIWYRRTVCRR